MPHRTVPPFLALVAQRGRPGRMQDFAIAIAAVSIFVRFQPTLRHGGFTVAAVCFFFPCMLQFAEIRQPQRF
jgi:hypothetical protein